MMRFFIIFILLIFISGCSCDEKQKCAALTTEASECLLKIKNQGISQNFTSGSGANYNFGFKNQVFSPEYLADGICPSWTLEPKCDCRYSCYSHGAIWYLTSTPNSFNLLEYYIDERDNSTSDLARYYGFKIFDFEGYYNEDGYGSPNHIKYDSIMLGGVYYQNIHMFERDTILEPGKKIWKVYLTFEKGIIGFIEIPSQELFIRQ